MGMGDKVILNLLPNSGTSFKVFCTCIIYNFEEFR